MPPANGAVVITTARATRAYRRPRAAGWSTVSSCRLMRRCRLRRPTVKSRYADGLTDRGAACSVSSPVYRRRQANNGKGCADIARRRLGLLVGFPVGAHDECNDCGGPDQDEGGADIVVPHDVGDARQNERAQPERNRPKSEPIKTGERFTLAGAGGFGAAHCSRFGWQQYWHGNASGVAATLSRKFRACLDLTQKFPSGSVRSPTQPSIKYELTDALRHLLTALSPRPLRQERPHRRRNMCTRVAREISPASVPRRGHARRQCRRFSQARGNSTFARYRQRPHLAAGCQGQPKSGWPCRARAQCACQMESWRQNARTDGSDCDRQ